MAVQFAKRLLTIDEYHRMVETGILTEEENVELINGEIYEMSPVGSEHSACVKRLNKLLNKLLEDLVLISVQDPVQIPDISELQPDIALLRPRSNFFADAHPGPEDVFLVIEVAESSLYKDRTLKLPVYATAGIPEYWIVNLEDREVEIYRKPVKDQYLFQETIQPGGMVALPAFNLEIRTDELIGEH